MKSTHSEEEREELLEIQITLKTTLDEIAKLIVFLNKQKDNPDAHVLSKRLNNRIESSNVKLDNYPKKIKSFESLEDIYDYYVDHVKDLYELVSYELKTMLNSINDPKNSLTRPLANTRKIISDTVLSMDLDLEDYLSSKLNDDTPEYPFLLNDISTLATKQIIRHLEEDKEKDSKDITTRSDAVIKTLTELNKAKGLDIFEDFNKQFVNLQHERDKEKILSKAEEIIETFMNKHQDIVATLGIDHKKSTTLDKSIEISKNRTSFFSTTNKISPSPTASPDSSTPNTPRKSSGSDSK